MISVVAGGLIFIAMTYVGIGVKKIFEQRYKTMQYFFEFAKFADREISIYKTPINQIVNKFNLISNYKIDLLNKFLQLEIKNYDNCYKICDILCLKKSDKHQIANFLNHLGKGNYNEELKHLQSFIGNAKTISSKAKESLDKDGKLATKLFALMGIGLMIIVV